MNKKSGKKGENREEEEDVKPVMKSVVKKGEFSMTLGRGFRSGPAFVPLLDLNL